MKKQSVRVLVDLLMYFSLAVLIGTGLLIHYRLIPGYRGGHGLTLLGLSRHEWGTVHLWISYLLVFLIIVHLLLNAAFIKTVIARQKIWLLVSLILSGLLILLFFWFTPLEQAGSGGQKHGARHRHSQNNTR